MWFKLCRVLILSSIFLKLLRRYIFAIHFDTDKKRSYSKIDYVYISSLEKILIFKTNDESSINSKYIALIIQTAVISRMKNIWITQFSKYFRNFLLIMEWEKNELNECYFHFIFLVNRMIPLCIIFLNINWLVWLRPITEL